MSPCTVHSAWPSRLVLLSALTNPVALLKSMQKNAVVGSLAKALELLFLHCTL